MSQTAPLWKNGESGSQYQYANHNRLQKEEPDTCRILELQEGFRARDDTYIYFVNHHEKYGWSVARAKLREPDSPTLASNKIRNLLLVLIYLYPMSKLNTWIS
jgi:hypothetical protein